MSRGLWYETTICITETYKVGFEIQSPIFSRCGACPAPRNAGFGGWAGRKYEPPVRSLPLLGLPVFHKHRFVFEVGEWVIEPGFIDQLDGLGRLPKPSFPLLLRRFRRRWQLNDHFDRFLPNDRGGSSCRRIVFRPVQRNHLRPCREGIKGSVPFWNRNIKCRVPRCGETQIVIDKLTPRIDISSQLARPCATSDEWGRWRCCRRRRSGSRGCCGRN